MPNFSKLSVGEEDTTMSCPLGKRMEIMRERLETDAGREQYRKRQGIVESNHGHDQKNLGWRQHHLRGLAKAGLELMLLRLAGNIGKVARCKVEEFLAYA